MIDENILDHTEKDIKRHVYFDKEEKLTLDVLWTVGSYFLRRKDIKVFDAYGIKAYMSPESGSGKTRGLEITNLLA